MSLLILLALVPMGVVLIWAMSRVPLIGAVGTAAVILSQWDLPVQAPLLSVAGSSVYFPDLVCVCLFLAGLLKWRLVRDQLGASGFLWLLLAILAVFSVGRGVLAYGLGLAVNEGRLLLLPLLATIWAFSIDWSAPGVRKQLSTALRVVGWLLTALALYHAVRYGVGSASSAFIEVDGVAQSNRVLTQLQALILGAAGLFAFHEWQSLRRRLSWVDACVFLAVVVISQQRTVWVATVVGLGLLALKSGQRGRGLLVALLALLAIGAALLSTSAWGANLLDALGTSIADQGTYEGRLASWPQLIEASLRAGDFAVLFGQPMGAGFVRVEPNGLIATWSPHNWYLLLFLRTGLIGLFLYLSAIGVAVLGSMRRTVNPLSLAVLAQFVIFCWSYGYSWVSALPVGWAVVASLARKSSSPDFSSRNQRIRREASNGVGFE